MRKNYTCWDLVKFLHFSRKPENKDLKPMDMVKAYNKENPELSSREQLINVSKALGINSLHKAVTGKDIPEDDPLYLSWREQEKEIE